MQSSKLVVASLSCAELGTAQHSLLYDTMNVDSKSFLCLIICSLINTSLTPTGTLTNRLQLCTIWEIQNGRQEALNMPMGSAKGLPLGFRVLPSTFANFFYFDQSTSSGKVDEGGGKSGEIQENNISICSFTLFLRSPPHLPYCAMGHWNTRTLGHWNIGIPGHWDIRTLELQNTGTLDTGTTEH